MEYHTGHKFGQSLYNQCRGIDERVVNPNRIRKSLSVEETFVKDISNISDSLEQIRLLYIELLRRIGKSTVNRPIKSQSIKIKFNNFKQVTAELAAKHPDLDTYIALFNQIYAKYGIPIRLLGIGVHFDNNQKINYQLSLFKNAK